MQHHRYQLLVTVQVQPSQLWLAVVAVVPWHELAELLKSRANSSYECTGALTLTGLVLWPHSSLWGCDDTYYNDWQPSLRMISMLKKSTWCGDLPAFCHIWGGSREDTCFLLSLQTMLENKELYARTIPTSSDFTTPITLTETSHRWKQNYVYLLGSIKTLQVKDGPTWNRAGWIGEQLVVHFRRQEKTQERIRLSLLKYQIYPNAKCNHILRLLLLLIFNYYTINTMR